MASPDSPLLNLPYNLHSWLEFLTTLLIGLEVVSMIDPSKRRRNVPHIWCDKIITRIFRKNLSKDSYRLAHHIYLCLCEIDSDFSSNIDDTKIGLRNLTKTCVSYSGHHRDTVSTYLQFFREIGLIDYGLKRDSNGLVIGSYLIMFGAKKQELVEKIANTKNEKVNKIIHSPTDRTMDKKLLIHSPTSRTSVQQDSYKNDINITFDKNSFFLKKKRLERVFEKTRSVRFPKIIFSDNGDKDSSAIEEQSPISLLGDWLDYEIKPTYMHRPIFDLRTKLYQQKIKPSARLIQRILDYWNTIATGLKLNKYLVPIHRIKNNKITNMCQIIITGLSKINDYSETEIKKAIDNFAIIVNNSPWYFNNKKPSNFVEFFCRQKLFEDCITDNIKGNSRYFNVKGGNGTSLVTILEKKLRQYSKTNYGREPEGEELKYIKQEAWNEHDKILANRGIPKDKRKELLMKEWKEINHAG